MKYKTLFFDLDDTLYSNKTGLWEAILERMSLYMFERLGLSWDVIPELRNKYYRNYGTTLRGLQIHYQVEADDYLKFVHDLPLEDYLQPDPLLRQLILSLPQRRWIFTNANAEHAERVLGLLQLEGCFEGIIDVRAMDFACKPDPIAFYKAIYIAGMKSSSGCVLIDDMPQNLRIAQQLGFTTVLVGERLDGNLKPDFQVNNLMALPQIMPNLWQNNPGV